MNKVVGVYETREEAVDAAKALENAGFGAETISIYNRDDLTNNHIRIKMSHRFEVAEMGLGVAIGTICGILSGMGFFMAPGLRFLYNVGPIRGGLGGAILGLLISTAIALLTSFIIHMVTTSKNERALNEGKYLVFYDGHRRADIHRAHEVLHTRDIPVELTAH